MDTERIYSLEDLLNWEYSGTALAVIGKPIRHSLSPVMHNAVLQSKVESDPRIVDWAYFRFEIDPDDLPQALQLFHQKRFYGLNLTVPHKVIALDLIASVSEEARAIGAVNTLKWTKLGYQGFNTDGYGMRVGIAHSLKTELKENSVLILGAGGAARAAAVECLKEKTPSICMLNRTPERLNALLQSLSNLEGSDRLMPLTSSDPGALASLGLDGICINATSLGMCAEDPLPVDLAQLPPRWKVYDMIYNPRETALYREARAQKRSAATGLSMLVHQGAKAMELWSGQSVGADCMYLAAERVLNAQASEY